MRKIRLLTAHQYSAWPSAWPPPQRLTQARPPERLDMSAQTSGPPPGLLA
jgi:hypothetical protein